MKEFIKNLKFTWKYAREDKKYLFIIIFVYIVSIICSIITPIYSAKIVIGLTSNDYVQMLIIAGVIFLLDMLQNFSHYIARRCIFKMYNNILSRIGLEVGSNILKIENESLDKNGNGVFIQRMTSDTAKMAEMFDNLINTISDVIKYVGILVAIFIVNKLVFIYVILFAIILYLIEEFRTKRRKENDKITRVAKEKVTGFVGELVRGARDIRMLNSEDDFMNELSFRIKDANEKQWKMNKSNMKYRISMWCTSSTSDFILILLLIILLKREIILPSIALVLSNYADRVSASAYFIGSFLEEVKDFNLSCERVFAIINGEEFKKEKFGSIHLDKVNGDFEFKDVSFSYTDKKVLNKINFKINANETVAFVGKSGAGKTTIFNLLCKMYDVDSGSILIDGIDIKKLDKDTIRGNITIISQNPYIFNMSIRDNLRLVKKTYLIKK